MPNNRLANVLNDREATAFVGVKNAASIVNEFISYPHASRLSITGLEHPSVRCWPVKDLCAVYGVDSHTAMNRLQKLISAGRITGPLLISRK
ncbi:MAG: hypothetical protein PHF31_05790 [Methylobacter sp.]|nr:hypothetical protein [Methylobacter sp.]